MHFISGHDRRPPPKRDGHQTNAALSVIRCRRRGSRRRSPPRATCRTGAMTSAMRFPSCGVMCEPAVGRRSLMQRARRGAAPPPPAAPASWLRTCSCSSPSAKPPGLITIAHLRSPAARHRVRIAAAYACKIFAVEIDPRRGQKRPLPHRGRRWSSSMLHAPRHKVAKACAAAVSARCQAK